LVPFSPHDRQLVLQTWFGRRHSVGAVQGQRVASAGALVRQSLPMAHPNQKLIPLRHIAQARGFPGHCAQLSTIPPLGHTKPVPASAGPTSGAASMEQPVFVQHKLPRHMPMHSQPLVGKPSQSLHDGAQAEVHALFAQLPVMCGGRPCVQSCVQLPQWVASVARSTHADPHWVTFDGQLATHAPPLHNGVAGAQGAHSGAPHP
jgi:hypothetical protein